MKKFKSLLALVAAIAVSLFVSPPKADAGWANYSIAVNVTSANSVVTPTASFGIPTSVIVANKGATDIFVDFDRVAVAASTTAYRLESCKQLVVNHDSVNRFTTLGLITSSGSSTAQVTVNYLAGAPPNNATPTWERVKFESVPNCSLTSGIGPTANGASWLPYVDTEQITLSTVGLTTDSTADLLHANSIIDAVVCFQTTAITTSTNWGISDPTTANRFKSATAIATTSLIGLDQWNPAGAGVANGPQQLSAAKLRITVTVANPGAGVVRCSVFGRTAVAPVS